MMVADENANHRSPEKLPEYGGGETATSDVPGDIGFDMEMLWSSVPEEDSELAQAVPQDPSQNFLQHGFSHGYMIAESNLKASVTSNILEFGMPLFDGLHSQFSSMQYSDSLDDMFMSSYMLSTDSPPFSFPSELNFDIGSCYGDHSLNVRSEECQPSTCYANLDSILDDEELSQRTYDVPQDGAYLSTRRETDCKLASQAWTDTPYLCSAKQEVCAEDRTDSSIDMKPFNKDGAVTLNEPPNPSCLLLLPSNSHRTHLVYRKDDCEGTSHESGDPDSYSDLFHTSTTEKPHLYNNDHTLSGHIGDRCDPVPSTLNKQELECAKPENIHGLQKSTNSCSLPTTYQSAQSSFAQRTSAASDDGNNCIQEDASGSTIPISSVSNGKSHVNMHYPTISEATSHARVGHKRFKPNKEQFVFRTALLDLSQPRSEDEPPDGVLAVPLLRHQRIALSWMVKRETNTRCSGGILADDQGLGKTISTIALILKERSPSFRASAAIKKPTEAETLNLDDDDDDDTTSSSEATMSIKNPCVVNTRSAPVAKPSIHAKGRAAAGTLIVCPTSVLRQWSDELHHKVANVANLTVLVYHGCNRTKDPFELANYDVVLTTYSIVSMEVPKQPIDDEDDDDRRKHTSDSIHGSSSFKKRKSPQSSEKKSSKGKKGTDGELIDNLARPLGRVAWFRVVLDEAQSIKNYKTQVARACWGLRAKRRWCLSGTPIQNAIDDLYSYFRFLRFEPYSSYKQFCSSLKVPIQRNPSRGYIKLQTVLKAVMLRRTKGTYIDGEPVIILPPKRIELKKVEFTQWERDFYCRLEADSRAQFAKYAAAGTVKQNYVNILLMLLRLRQACDHPHLVERSNKSSVFRTSLEMVKKLSQEKRYSLLTCLEASLAICSICSDPPEDAVVTVCGHVFCNQCICEHLTGDNTHCPTTDCKTELSVSSLFSKTMLMGSASDQHSHSNSTTDNNDSDPGQTPQLYSFGCSYDSSKIKAVLGVLRSLSKPQDCPTMLNSPDHDEDKGSRNQTSKIAGEKALVFSQWTGMLDLLEECLKRSSIQYRRLDGTMSVVARDKAVKDFKTVPEVSVMIMSLKAASLGLNMVAACHVILLDLWWNPTTEDQAIDRAHRIGQSRSVTVLRLTVKDTVEDRILALQEKKRKMVASAFGEDKNGSQEARLTVEDLEYLFCH